MNLNETLPELIRSAKEIITSTSIIRQFEESRIDLQAGYPLDSQLVTTISTTSRALETALLKVEQALTAIEAERRQLETAFAALTSDEPEDRPPRPLVHRGAEERPVVTTTQPVAVAIPVDVTPAQSAGAPATDKPKGEKKSATKIERCKKCHKRKKCLCDKKT